MHFHFFHILSVNLFRALRRYVVWIYAVSLYAHHVRRKLWRQFAHLPWLKMLVNECWFSLYFIAELSSISLNQICIHTNTYNVHRYTAICMLKKYRKQTRKYPNCHRDMVLLQLPIAIVATVALYTDPIHLIFMNHPHFVLRLLAFLRAIRFSPLSLSQRTGNYENVWMFQAIYDFLLGSPCAYVHPN